jgi:hypothetical protein
VGPLWEPMPSSNSFASHLLLAAAISTVTVGCGSGSSPPVHSPIVDVSPRQTVGAEQPMSGVQAVETASHEASAEEQGGDRVGLVGKVFSGPDGDEDGIQDDDDKCPSAPEDLDGFEDRDGCPEPDNDADGVADWDDKCPNAPETFNGFEDSDGCPDANLDRAKRAFREGATAFAQGDYATARKHFEDAYALEPRDQVLYNIAVCAEKQGDRKYACQIYRKWRATTVGSTSSHSIASLDTCP